MTLDELQKLCDQTTITVENSMLVLHRLASGHVNQDDADFIAAARNHMGKLIAIARLLKQAVECDFLAGPSGFDRECGEALDALEKP